MPSNANINQNAQGVWSGNNVQVSKGATSVSFNNHAKVSCTITFTNAATFGMSSTTVNAQTNNSLTIVSAVNTDYNLPSSPYPEGPQYTITIDTGEDLDTYQQSA